jgi:hypothetical protein
MKSFLTALTGLCLLGITCFGQIDAETSQKRVIIKLSPLALFDFDNTVQLGAEVPLGLSRFSIQQDMGYGRSSFNVWRTSEDSRPFKETYKGRTQLRYYYLQRRRFKAYVAGEYLFKKVVYTQNQWVGMDCAGWNCGYFESRFVKVARNVNAGHVKMGWQFYFGNRMALDIFSGLGLRNIQVESITPVLGNTRIEQSGEWFEYDTPGTNETIPSIAMGFHFGIILGKFDR